MKTLILVLFAVLLASAAVLITAFFISTLSAAIGALFRKLGNAIVTTLAEEVARVLARVHPA